MVRRYKNISLLFGIMLCMIAMTGCYDDTDIVSIKSFLEVDFTAFEEGDLILFDVDDTLIQFDDMFLTNKYTIQGKKLLAKYFFDLKFLHEMSAIVVEQAKKKLIEPDIITTIDTLQKRGLFVCAITKLQTGKQGSIEKLEASRYENLKTFGFKGSWSDEEHAFENLEGRPVFYRGILATGGIEKKGVVLGAFLDWKQLKPKKIIMFDDIKSYLRSVRQECEKRNIQFEGYHYQGATSKVWNDELAHFQINYLKKYKEWLSDEEAQQLMESESFS